MRDSRSRFTLDRAGRTAGVVLLAAVVHYVFARVCLELSSAGKPAPIWIAAGFDAALVVLLGRRAAVGIFAADLLAGMSLGRASLEVLAGPAAGNTLGALGAAWIITRFCGRGGSPRELRDVLALAFGAAPVSALVSATTGVLWLSTVGTLPADAVAGAWRTWFLSDLAGVVVLTPAVLVLATRSWRLPSPRRAVEGVAMLAALAVTFVPALESTERLTYLIFPVVAWAALRFRLVGAATVSVLASVVATALTVRAHGASGAGEAVLDSQGFLALITLTGLLLAVVSEEREQALRKLAHRAWHDPQTGLPNRTLLAERLEEALARADADGTMLAVLLLDLDQFKYVNDSFGHHTGDELLAQMAPRLRAAARPGDTVARFGGDEFVVLCEGLAGPWEALEAARGLASAWAQPFSLGDEEVFISGSAGIAVTRAGRADPAALLREADAAMYRAKERGRGQVELYDEVMRARAYDQLRLESELRHALEAGDITVAYQPIVSFGDGRPVAVEALARWTHPERGSISPAAFIEAAEESGLIAELGRLVLRTACLQVARWRAELPGAEQLQVSVNVSARQIARGELPGDVKDALAESGLPPDALALEVTESALMEETDAPGPVLALLRSLGVRIVLDDFGTGYSSLSYLRRFPLDGLKLDRSFVDGLGRPDAAAVVEAIITMGATLGLAVTAEGVETREHAERLRELGCPFGQGYMLARPLPAGEIAAVLADRLRRRPSAARDGLARTARNEY